MTTSEKILLQFRNLENRLILKLSRELFYPHMCDSYHGIGHTTRVLFGTHLLLRCIQDVDDDVMDAVYYACIIHDLGRTHDRACLNHGEISAKLYFPKIKELVSGEILQNQVFEAIKYHSIEDKDCPQKTCDNIVFKILKDADALDRGRLYGKCDKSFLRLAVFKTEIGERLIDFMDRLAYQTQHLKWENPYQELTDYIQSPHETYSDVTKKPMNAGKILFHGTSMRLNKGDFLKCSTAYDSSLFKSRTSVFATTDFRIAKFFGIRRCLTEKGSTILQGKKIYVDSLRTNLLRKFYVYTVDNDGFILDGDGEYISFNDTKIINVIEFNLTDEISAGEWEIYLLDKIPEGERKKKIDFLYEYIELGKHRRLDVSIITKTN
ncbi:HD domain-containing protein [Bacteroidales bacterium OttesenSCG-928-C03]|nr:HD domain-containing protein [Bacteroidales bacterium OttesenSCG-928-C03]MDL2326725.1 HD domain-containing protein [Bacteroidales bacterium OttesenSCG-928-A14]